ncbi:radical SAM protein [Blautia pseudococcoides]|uniref:radical SAM protein n=1 Tax=Blautia pseudococcoides TaxID=1796616 RepID=UPI00148B0B0F|nr:radical SAM protein [Blautia pseudococcoides]QJU13828.1 radical SAM protein [Blautia pseudococcoides]
MHYTGTIWRPPYEASSLLLEVTAGCTHHRCKFCTLYEELPFKFRMSPLADIEEDLMELKEQSELWPDHHGRRVFLTGANPFVLKYGRLMEIASLIHRYHPAIETIGCFARVTDVTAKTDKELSNLRQAGYDGITIGIETGDDEALIFMDKGYLASDIIQQCSRLDKAGISYNFFYLTSISGAGRGEIGAKATAEVCNQLHPVRIGANMLTVYPESGLYQEIQKGNWKEEGELEKYMELRTLVKNLKIPVYFGALGASNAFQLQGILPRDKEKLLYTLDQIIETVSEEELQRYRRNLPHL